MLADEPVKITTLIKVSHNATCNFVQFCLKSEIHFIYIVVVHNISKNL